MKNFKWSLIIIVVLLVISFFLGFKFAGGLGILLGGGALSLKKKADKAQKEQKKLQKKADKIEKESDQRAEKAEKLEQSGEDREEKAEKLKDRLRETDDNFKNMFNVILILVLSVSILFTGPALAHEDINPENFKQPDTLAEAEKMLDTLLDYTLDFRNISYENEKLYEKEKRDKEMYKELYEAEREDTQKLQTIIDNQARLNDMLQEIIDKLIKNQSSKFSIYGGMDENKEFEGGIIFSP